MKELLKQLNKLNFEIETSLKMIDSLLDELKEGKNGSKN